MLRFLSIIALAMSFSLPALAADEGLTLWHSYRGAEEDALRKSVELFQETNPELNITLLSIPYEVMASKVDDGDSSRSWS